MVEDVMSCWVEAILAASMLARGERLGELRGARPPRFDPQGIHPYSVEWGRIFACEALFPPLQELRYCGEPLCTPIGLRRLAQREAEAEFRDEILAGG